jgi:hypothetical protein
MGPSPRPKGPANQLMSQPTKPAQPVLQCMPYRVCAIGPCYSTCCSTHAIVTRSFLDFVSHFLDFVMHYSNSAIYITTGCSPIHRCSQPIPCIVRSNHVHPTRTRRSCPRDAALGIDSHNPLPRHYL